MCNNNIGSRLKTLRQNAHMSQSSLGNLVGKDGTTIGRYENNSLSIPSDVLLILSQHFKVSIDWILTGESAYTQLDTNSLNCLSLFQELSAEDQLDVIELLQFKLYKRTGKLSTLKSRISTDKKFDKMA